MLPKLRYFWYWRPRENWPPPSIEDPAEIRPGDRLNVVCTQTGQTPAVQRKLVRQWCERLPTLEGLRYLWFNSRVPQALFDAACRVPGLEGLYVKWSGIKSIEALGQAESLRQFHLGSSTGLTSIEPLRQMRSLSWLGIENVKRISSLEPIADLTQLEGLAVDGSVWTTQYVDTLEPIGELFNLRYLSLINLRSRDRSLAPLFRLSRLEVFEAATWWKDSELSELLRRNPNLTA